jgi:uncharacterized protein YbjQ (UPF0145 family)
MATPEPEGAARYLGAVCGEAILGVKIFKCLCATIRDVVGGRSSAYGRELRRARDMAREEMEEEACSHCAGCTAVRI